MLIRRKGTRQEVAIDAWEPPECRELIAKAFMQVGIDPNQQWTITAYSLPVTPSKGNLVLVANDRETGWSYWRRTTDLERLLKWNANPMFMIDAKDW